MTDGQQIAVRPRPAPLHGPGRPSRRRLPAWAALAVLLSGAPVGAAAAGEAGIALGLPVDCALGQRCFIHNYVDRAAGDAAADFTCGPLSYDDHSGTDFRTGNLAEMRRGVAVLAAAGGVVRAARDGEPDVNVRQRGLASVRGRECGNGVVLDHGDGWATQYCHLRRGSLRVAPGDKVAAGAPLGAIGLSGLSEFPHLHFEVRHKDRPVDPFTGSAPGTPCGEETVRPLWSEEAAGRLAYRASALINAGFSLGAPSAADIAEGRQAPAQVAPDAPALVFWWELFGERTGDVHVTRLLAPDGTVLAEKALPASDRPRAARWTYLGTRRPAGGWPAGTYVGLYELHRSESPQRLELRVRREIAVR